MKSRGFPSHRYQVRTITAVLGIGFWATGCGTEIGNGRKKEKSSASPAPDKASETVNSGTTNTSSGLPSSKGSAFDFLLRACGSPVVEMKAARFKETLSSTSLTVTVPSPDTWTLVNTDSILSATVTRDASAASNPYAIQSFSINLGTETCVSTVSDTTANVTTRTVTYSDGFKTSWTLSAGAVITEIRVVNASGSVVQTFVPQ